MTCHDEAFSAPSAPKLYRDTLIAAEDEMAE
jgi:hypothetical protein